MRAIKTYHVHPAKVADYTPQPGHATLVYFKAGEAIEAATAMNKGLTGLTVFTITACTDGGCILCGQRRAMQARWRKSDRAYRDARRARRLTRAA